MGTSRRVFLGLMAATPLLAHTATTAHADGFDTYSEIYTNPNLREGVDYARRSRRHAAFGKTVVFAPHGGGIERGTSELCLAVAGYHPATLQASGATYDHWMFEGIRSSNNGALHVTSTGCDDHYARSLAAGALNAVSLHGCTLAAAQQGRQQLENPAAALVGGANGALRTKLLDALRRAGIYAVDASTHPSLDGTDPRNIVNRTLLGTGAQLELTAELRDAMFLETGNTIADRKNSLKPEFWSFVGAVREGIAAHEATQVIL